MTSPVHQTAAVVLGAGKGTRMKSELPKVLHPLAGKAMIQRVVNTLRQLGIQKVCVVLSKDTAPFKAFIDHNELVVTIQDQQQGTADGVASASPAFQGVVAAPYNASSLHSGSPFDAENVLVCYGDTPLICPEVLGRFIGDFSDQNQSLSVLGIALSDPTGYGRLILGQEDHLEAIVEHKDATDEQRKINLCNSGIILAKKSLLFELLAKVSDDNAQKEYYLTDVVGLAAAEGIKANVFATDQSGSFDGINDKMQLARLEQRLVDSVIAGHLRGGVTIQRPSSVWIEDDVTIGTDCLIEPGAVIKGQTAIGKGVTIGAGAYLVDAKVADHSHVAANSTVGTGTASRA